MVADASCQEEVVDYSLLAFGLLMAVGFELFIVEIFEGLAVAASLFVAGELLTPLDFHFLQ